MVRLVDEASLLACAAYVDLNPIRAAICETIESSDHTSLQRRIEEATDDNSQKHGRGAGFLAPLSINEQSDPIGPCASELNERCSDKGFLSLSLTDYLELLDWSARQVSPGKRGKTPSGLPPVLKRVGMDRESWCELVSDFGKLFCTVAGRPEQVDAMRSHCTHRRYRLRRRARELFSDLS